MQLFGSIIAALAIVAVTIAIVTAQLGPFAEDDDGGGSGGDRQEQELATTPARAATTRTRTANACSAGAWTGTRAPRSRPSAASCPPAPS